MPKLSKNSNKIWIYVGILVLIIVIAFIWLAYFQGNETLEEPAEENDFKGPTAEEQEELLRRITESSAEPGSGSSLSSEEEGELREGMTATSGSTLSPEEEERLRKQMSTEE